MTQEHITALEGKLHDQHHAHAVEMGRLREHNARLAQMHADAAASASGMERALQEQRQRAAALSDALNQAVATCDTLRDQITALTDHKAALIARIVALDAILTRYGIPYTESPV